MAEITPIRPGTEQLDPEVEKVILARLETFDEDVKTSVPARVALNSIRKNLKHLALR
jgi:hypothetical protein